MSVSDLRKPGFIVARLSKADVEGGAGCLGRVGLQHAPMRPSLAATDERPPRHLAHALLHHGALELHGSRPRSVGRAAAAMPALGVPAQGGKPIGLLRQGGRPPSTSSVAAGSLLTPQTPSVWLGDKAHVERARSSAGQAAPRSSPSTPSSEANASRAARQLRQGRERLNSPSGRAPAAALFWPYTTREA